MIDQLVTAYAAARSRLLLFDYDGVLMPIVDSPELARPTDELLRLMRNVSVQPANKLVVISGRDNAALEQWLGELPIDMSAEHGHFIKESGVWHAEPGADMSWRADVQRTMERLVAEYPGSHIENKQAGLVWHYRQVSVPVDEHDAEGRISQSLQGRAVVMASKRALDVRAKGADKGAAARHWYDQKEWDFVVCIGDDVTDEAMFSALPESAWTIKVGSGPTKARHQFEEQAEVIDLLCRLSS